MHRIFFGYIKPVTYLDEKAHQSVFLFQKTFAPLSASYVGDEPSIIEQALKSQCGYLIVQDLDSGVQLSDIQTAYEIFERTPIRRVRFHEGRTYMVDLNHIRAVNPPDVLQYISSMEFILMEDGRTFPVKLYGIIRRLGTSIDRAETVLPNQEIFLSADELVGGLERLNKFPHWKPNRLKRQPITGRFNKIIVQSSVFDVLELIASGVIVDSSILTMLYRNHAHEYKVRAVMQGWQGESPLPVTLHGGSLRRPFNGQDTGDEIAEACYSAILERFGGKRNFLELWRIFRERYKLSRYSMTIGGERDMLTGNDLILLGDGFITSDNNLRFDQTWLEYRYSQLRSMMLKGQVMLHGYTPSGVPICP